MAAVHETRSEKMKQLHTILLPTAVLLWLLVFTPLSEGVLDYVFLIAGTLAAIGGLMIKESKQLEINSVEQSEHKEQQKRMEELIQQLIESNYKQLGEQKNTTENLTAVHEELKDVKTRMMSNSQEHLTQLKEQDTNQKYLIESMVHDLTASQKNLGNTIEEAFGEINTSIQHQTVTYTESINDLGRSLSILEDACKDIEESVSRQVNEVINILEDGQEDNHQLVNEIAEYNNKVNEIQTSFTEFLPIQMKEQIAITEILQQSVSELASSKHTERQQAMKVQKKLIEQYAKL